MRTELVPLWFDWRGRFVLVVGLGEVGQRRALTFQRAGAVTIGVDPMPVSRRSEWGELIRGGLELRAEPYAASIYDELKEQGSGPDLVLACATPEVNQRVVRDAVGRRVWVVSATSESADSDEDRVSPSAHMSAVASGSHVQFAVRTGNAAPALAVTLRDRFEADWLAPADRLAEEMAKWRGRITRDAALSADDRKRLLSIAGDPELLALESARAGIGVDALRKRLAAGLGIDPDGLDRPHNDDANHGA